MKTTKDDVRFAEACRDPARRGVLLKELLIQRRVFSLLLIFVSLGFAAAYFFYRSRMAADFVALPVFGLIFANALVHRSELDTKIKILLIQE